MSGDYYRGDSGVHYILNAAGAAYAWQVNPEISASKVVDGSAMTLLTDVARGGSITSAIWNGTEFVNSIQFGQGCGCNLYICSAADTAKQQWAPTEPGAQDDDFPYFGSSNFQLLGKNAAGDGLYKRLQPAYWLRPSEILTPGFPAINTRVVTDIVCTASYQIGFAGTDHIILVSSEFVIPEDPVIQAATLLSFIPFYCYGPNSLGAGFSVIEWVNFTTGATRAWSAGQTSTTEVAMYSTADGTKAQAIVNGPGVQDAGFYNAFQASGTPGFSVGFGFPIKSYPNGVPAGIVRMSSGWCFGTRANLIGGGGYVVTASNNLPAGVYP